MPGTTVPSILTVGGNSSSRSGRRRGSAPNNKDNARPASSSSSSVLVAGGVGRASAAPVAVAVVTTPPSSPQTRQTSTFPPGKSQQQVQQQVPPSSDKLWLLLCFLGISASFVCYGLLLEYTTSNGRHLHELSFLFVTSIVYTLTAAAGRYVRDEIPTNIPPARFALLGFTSMGSTFCSVRSLRYVIYPIQVLAKSCKPVPVMLMGALLGKRYPRRKYLNVVLIVSGVGLFMGGGARSSPSNKRHDETNTGGSGQQLMGITLLFISLCFDGGTGAYEDKLMAVHSVGPFDLMYNIQLGKTILAGVALLVLNQVHVFLQMCSDMGFLLVALGLSGALGQVFIFVTISKFGALTCSIIGLARKVITLVASIYFYGHSLTWIQFIGLLICVGSMVADFLGKNNKKKKAAATTSSITTTGADHHQHGPGPGHYDNPVTTPLSTSKLDSSYCIEMNQVTNKYCEEEDDDDDELEPIISRKDNKNQVRDTSGPESGNDVEHKVNDIESPPLDKGNNSKE